MNSVFLEQMKLKKNFTKLSDLQQLFPTGTLIQIFIMLYEHSYIFCCPTAMIYNVLLYYMM